MGWNRRNTNVVLEVIVGLMALTIVVLIKAGFLRTKKQGFYCDDASIRFPLVNETVTNTDILNINFFLPLVVTLIVEGFVITSAGSLGARFRRFVTVFAAYFKGWLGSALLNLVLKMITGQTRPNFLDVCRPDFSKLNCSQGYITEYTCTNDVTQKVIVDAHLSFPSGHAQCMFYMATFLILYLHKYVGARPTAFVHSMLDMALVVLAVYVSVSRITEYRHHLSDVVAGAMIGVLLGVYVFVLFLFKNLDVVAVEEEPSAPLEAQLAKNGAEPISDPHACIMNEIIVDATKMEP